MYLLDTNVLICALFAPERLSATARKVVEGSETLFVSVVSLWEIAIKQSIGKLDIDASIPEIADACATLHIDLLPVSAEHIEGIKLLPRIHGDPFDRLIIAQAMYENHVLITMDQTIPKYAVKTLW